MIRQIYKYPLELAGKQVIKLPLWEIMDIQIQNGTPCLWATISDDMPVTEVQISCYGTGHKLSSDENGKYIATTQMNGYVWHWFVSKVR